MMTLKSAVKTAPLLAAVLLAVLGVTATPVGAQQILNPATGHLYELLPPGDLPTQIAAAAALGGYLVTVNDAAENQWIVDNFASGADTIYIGLVNPDPTAATITFEWVNGETPGYGEGSPPAAGSGSWNAGEPNNYNDGGTYDGEEATLLKLGAGTADPDFLPTGMWGDVNGHADPYAWNTAIGAGDWSGVAEIEVLPGPTAAITRVGAVDSAFTSGSGSWTVDFSEDVLNVNDADFSLDTLGDAVVGTGPTVTGGPASYTASISGVTGVSGTIILNFDVGDVVSVADGTPAEPASGGAQWFSNVVPAPAAMGWVLVFLGVVLALAAAVVIRKKALKH